MEACSAAPSLKKFRLKVHELFSSVLTDFMAPQIKLLVTGDSAVKVHSAEVGSLRTLNLFFKYFCVNILKHIFTCTTST